MATNCTLTALSPAPVASSPQPGHLARRLLLLALAAVPAARSRTTAAHRTCGAVTEAATYQGQ